LKKIPLSLGPLSAAGYSVRRSFIHWLCEPGQMCRANQVVGYFNLSLEPDGTRPAGPAPFAEERDLQIAIAPRVAGRVKFDASASPGGYLSNLAYNTWEPDTAVAYLEVDGSAADLDEDAGRLRLLMLAGRRMTPLVSVHSGLLSGWHSRLRGWWCENGEMPVTLLSMCICDATGVILGEQSAFLEMFRRETAPSQLVFVPDHPLAPAAPALLDQLNRSPAQFRAISDNLRLFLSEGGIEPTADDWTFAGTMLSALQSSPIRDGYNIISASGLNRCGPADAILLSLHSEPPSVLRHKTLGYRIHVMRHYQVTAGPALRGWFAKAFEPVPRTTEDIKADYEKVIDAIEKTTGAKIIVLNRMSTSGDENISAYAPFDAPMSGTLANIASKELNLMLHDLAADRNVAIVDVDAMAAEIGGREHLPDGVHQSGAMQEIIRAELMHILKDVRSENAVAK
jgi:hypothetical protein